MHKCQKHHKEKKEPLHCKKLRRAFEANNPTFFDNPDPIGVDYNIYFVNERTTFIPCTDIPGTSPPSASELTLLSEAFQIRGKYLCPMLVWAQQEGQGIIVLLNPGSPDPVRVIDTNPSPRARAYRICIQPII